MKRFIVLLSAALVFLGAAYAAPPERYEYWLDNNTAGKVTGEMTGTSFSASVPVGELSKGLHSFNFRMADSVGWGSIYRRHVYVAPLSADAAVWESWFDSDRANLQTGTVSGSSMNFNIDAAALTPGLHFFHYRMQNSYGEWGSIFRKSFLTVGNTRGANAYEYWFDTNYAAKASGTLTSGQNVYEVNVADLPRGLHFFNYRMKNGYDEWGAIYRKMFYTGTKTGWTDYEYWIDNNYAGKTTGTTDDKGSVSFSVPIGEFDRRGVHFFHLRGRNGNGQWGTVYRKLIMFYEGKDNRVLTGYRHRINDVDLGEETVKDTVADNYLITVDLPEDIGLSIDKRVFRFEEDAVSSELSDSIQYMFQPCGLAGWGAPVTWGLNISENHTAVIEDMAVPSERTFEKPSRLQFHAVRFTSAGGPLYVKASQSACLDIYKDGNKVMALTGEDLLANKEIQLEAGTYVGILYDVPVDEENPDSEVTLRLMDTNNSVPAPEIAYASGMVSMSCRMEGAEIYYTLDGSQPVDKPTTECTLYTEPFAVDRNLTVKAIAVIPDGSLEASDVATLAINEFRVADPRIDFVNLEVVITPDQTEGVKTYYTLDGTEPTESGTEYTAPFRVSGNVTVKARSFKEGYAPSGIAEYKYTHSVYVAPAPDINYDPAASTVTLTAKAEGCRLYYSVVKGAGDPAEWTEYSAPVVVAENCRVYGKSTMTGMYDSEVVYVDVNGQKASAPVIEFDNGTVTISSSLEGAEIYYTLDGSQPTWESSKYTEPFAVDRNLTVKAIAVMPDGSLDASDVATLVIDSYKVATPTYSFDRESKLLTLECATPNATISYNLDNEVNEVGQLLYKTYTSPIKIEGSHVVKAWATAPGFNQSDELTVEIVEEKCLGVTFSYNGRYLTMSTAEPGAEIRYVGRELAEDGTLVEELYDGTPIDVEGLGSFKAWTVKEGFSDSEKTSFEVEYYGTEDQAILTNQGQLRKCFEWNGGAVSSERFTVSVDIKDIDLNLNEDDFEWLREQVSIRHLDLSNVVQGRLPDRALALPNLVSVNLPLLFPDDLVESGVVEGPAVVGYPFGETDKLCAVDYRFWSNVALPSNLFDGVSNPNVLLYVNEASYADAVKDKVKNIVLWNRAERITLTEGYPFYCPKEFKAESISYTRDFTKVTGIDGDCAGWETIALPFAVESVSHAKGELKPFSVDPETEQLRYWLYAPDAYEWQRADEIQAYRPYLIAMPNNPAYYEPFNVGGTVTFSAKNAAVAATPDNLGFDFKGNRKLCANFMPKEAEAGILPVNDETYEYGGVSYVPGSQFVAGVRAVRPFEAYLQAERSLTRTSIFSRSEVENLMSDMDMKVWSEGKVICIRAGFSAKIRVYDTTGQLVRIADVKAGETSRVDDLNAGIYIVGNFKIMIK